jgi:aerobic-type carbon monoxide dehydrogenase small subunit (CoxS/CutS family)
VNKTILLEINGRQKEIQVDVRQSLLEVLREKLGLTGVKQGCAVGECGACTVLLDGEPIDACIFLAVWADGHSIRTVEGESRDGKLSKVQQAFVEEGAVQCGICTPGFVMAATALVEKHGDAPPDRHQIRLGMAGNLCRCTGYETIVTAVEKSIRDKKEKNR